MKPDLTDAPMPYFDPALANQTFAATGASLEQAVATAVPRLRAIPDDAAGRPLSAGHWSAKEVIGHLIDSAANNHQRFVRAQQQNPYRGPGYAQEHWVASQRHNERAWGDLIELWSAYNRHLAHVLAGIPESFRDVSCVVGDEPAATLSFIALDYVGHIHHHLRQVLAR